MGILHVIWIFRNHPRLAEECEQVSDPTDENLRATEMVRVQLDADGEVIELQNRSFGRYEIQCNTVLCM
jgi:hypothetical protein